MPFGIAAAGLLGDPAFAQMEVTCGDYTVMVTFPRD
jgi:hypothetical protein